MHEIASNDFYYKSEMKTRSTQESGYNVFGEMVLDFVERKTYYVWLLEDLGAEQRKHLINDELDVVSLVIIIENTACTY